MPGPSSPAASARSAHNARYGAATAAKLTVGFTAPPLIGDLCSPPQPGGYLGAENQAIRVQMVDATHYTWGFDNAAPLYRVQVTAKGGQLVKLTCSISRRTPCTGRSRARWWNSCRGRPLWRTANAWPSSPGISARWRQLQPGRPHAGNRHAGAGHLRHPVAGPHRQGRILRRHPEQNFFYLRVWNSRRRSRIAGRHPDRERRRSAIPVSRSPSPAAPLRAADYWIIAARPAAPDTVLPWLLTSPAVHRPTGSNAIARRLALIKWTTAGRGHDRSTAS